MATSAPPPGPPPPRPRRPSVASLEHQHPFEDVRWEGTLRCGCALSVLSLSGVDTVAQTFRASLNLRLTTVNAGRIQVTQPHARVGLGLDTFEPRIKFMNLLSANALTKSKRALPSGELCFTYQIDAVFSEIFELKDFPFDSQRLTFKLTSVIPAAKLDLVEAGAHARIVPRNFSQSNVYRMRPGIAFRKSATSPFWISRSGSLRPLLSMSLTVRRHPAYYLWNIILPQLLLNLMSLGSFALPRTETSARLSVSVTMVLTTVAFKLHSATHLPTVSYLTVLDWFSLGSFLFIFAVLLENVLSSRQVGWLDDAADTNLGVALLVAWVLHTTFTAFSAAAHGNRSAREARAGDVDSSSSSGSSGPRTRVGSGGGKAPGEKTPLLTDDDGDAV